MDQKRFTKFLASHSITYKKVKKVNKTEFAYVTFEVFCDLLFVKKKRTTLTRYQNEEQKLDATKKLEGLEIKGKKLTVQDKKIKPASGAHNRDSRGDNTNNESKEPSNINAIVAPLWQ